MATKHTPGPWFAEIDNPRVVIPGHTIKQQASPYRPIGIVMPHTGTKGPGEGIANAHLVAAAPRLLAALEETSERWRYLIDAGVLDQAPAEKRQAKRDLAKAEAAIKAAKGGV